MVGGVIIILVLIFFVIGESLFVFILLVLVVLMGVCLVLFFVSQSKIDIVYNILWDVDWSIFIFFMFIFVIIGFLEKIGVIVFFV